MSGGDIGLTSVLGLASNILGSGGELCYAHSSFSSECVVKSLNMKIFPLNHVICVCKKLFVELRELEKETVLLTQCAN